MGTGFSCGKSEEISFSDQVNRLGINFNQQLSNQSLLFLNTLWRNAPYLFDQMIAKLARHSLALKVYHIDRVVSLLHDQRALPETVLESLGFYLAQRPEIESRINTLFITNAPELLSSALRYDLIHHSLPHALEISTRVAKVMDTLSILTNKDAISCFLRAVVNVMVQFHDLEQKNKGLYHSVEEASAARVSGWIKALMGISEDSEPGWLIDYIANHIIVLGTTMIYSSKRTMDLSELFLDFQSVAASAGWFVNDVLLDKLPILPDSKAGFVHLIDSIMLIVGVCDKNPAAIYDVVVQQEANLEIATLPLIRSYIKTPLYIERFFTHGGFSKLFNASSSDRINQQAFFLALIPHLCMRTELCVLAQKQDASHFIQLILLLRKLRTNTRDPDEFMCLFRSRCQKSNINRLVSTIFFEAIDNEIHFCETQTQGLVFVANKLISMRFSPKSSSGVASGHFEPLINPLAPIRDAANLKALQRFYLSLDSSEQEALSCELLMAVVLQAGEIVAEFECHHMESSTMSRTTTMRMKSQRFQFGDADHSINREGTTQDSFFISKIA